MRTRDDWSRARFAAWLSLATAGLMAVASIVGIAMDAIWARETVAWRVQGLGQDWVDLVVVVPWLVVAAIAVLRGSRRAQLLLAGGLVYTAYSFVIYVFAVRFNALFLIYCATLGSATYALVAIALDLAHRPAAERRSWSRGFGMFQMIVAVAFAGLWLSEIVPSLIDGAPPASLAEVGLATNPVHALDLSLVLPAIFLAGWLAWRRDPRGQVAVAVMLGFEVLMNITIGALAVAAYVAGIEPGYGIAFVFAGLTLATAVMLFIALRGARSRTIEVAGYARAVVS
jgi:hypothetical protein